MGNRSRLQPPSAAAAPVFRKLVSIGRMPDQMQLRSVPAVTVRANRADEKIAVVRPRTLHDVGIEAPAFVGVHRNIDPQRSRRALASHAVTLSSPTDTYRAHRVPDRRARRI